MKRMTLVLAAVVVAIGCGDTASSGNKKVTITAPSSVELKPGETKNFEFTIKREGFDEDVKLKFSGLPEGVSAEGTVKKGATKYEVPFKAGEKEGEAKEASVTAEGPTGVKTDPAKFRVTVKK